MQRTVLNSLLEMKYDTLAVLFERDQIPVLLYPPNVLTERTASSGLWSAVSGDICGPSLAPLVETLVNHLKTPFTTQIHRLIVL